MKLLVSLAGRGGAVATRKELADEVWPDIIVGEEALTSAVSKLRSVLGDDPRKPRIVETIPRIGYRLLVPSTFGQDGTRQIDRRPAPGAERALAGVLVAGLILGASLWLWSGYPSGSPNSFEPLVSESITAMPGLEFQADLSPDGKRIVFAHADQRGSFRLYLQVLDGNGPIALTDRGSFDRSPVWSPDGSRIAFIRYRAGCHLYVIDLIGGSPRRVGDCGPTFLTELKWSPDGEWLAFSTRSTPKNKAGIALVSVETGERKRLTDPPDGHADFNHAYSPTGDRVAFVRRQLATQTDSLWLVDTHSLRARPISDAWEQIWGVSWTHDERHLVFSSNRNGSFMLWSLPVTGGPPRWLPIAGSESSRRPVISGAENRLLFESWRVDTDIWRMWIAERGKVQANRVIDTTDYISAPQLSNRGDRLAYYVSQGDHYDLWTSSANGSAAKLWPGRPILWGGAPRWARDDRSLLFVQLVGAHPQIHSLDFANNQLSVLTDEPNGAVTPSWSASGDHIYYSADRGDGWRIWRRRVDDSIDDHEPFPIVRGFAPQETLDGRSLLFTKPDEGGLWRIRHGETKPSRLPVRLVPRDWGNWAVVEGSVYYQSRAGGNHLLEFDLAGLKTTASIPLFGRLANPGLTMARDGSLVFGAMEASRDIDVRLVRSLPQLN